MSAAGKVASAQVPTAKRGRQGASLHSQATQTDDAEASVPRASSPIRKPERPAIAGKDRSPAAAALLVLTGSMKQMRANRSLSGGKT